MPSARWHERSDAMAAADERVRGGTTTPPTPAGRPEPLRRGAERLGGGWTRALEDRRHPSRCPAADLRRAGPSALLRVRPRLAARAGRSVRARCESDFFDASAGARPPGSARQLAERRPAAAEATGAVRSLWRRPSGVVRRRLVEDARAPERARARPGAAA